MNNFLLFIVSEWLNVSKWLSVQLFGWLWATSERIRVLVLFYGSKANEKLTALASVISQKALQSIDIGEALQNNLWSHASRIRNYAYLLSQEILELCENIRKLDSKTFEYLNRIMDLFRSRLNSLISLASSWNKSVSEMPLASSNETDSLEVIEGRKISLDRKIKTFQREVDIWAENHDDMSYIPQVDK